MVLEDGQVGFALVGVLVVYHDSSRATDELLLVCRFGVCQDHERHLPLKPIDGDIDRCRTRSAFASYH